MGSPEPCRIPLPCWPLSPIRSSSSIAAARSGWSTRRPSNSSAPAPRRCAASTCGSCGAAQPALHAGRSGVARRQHDLRIRRSARRSALRQPHRDDPGGAVAGEAADLLVLTLHERSIADKIDRQLTHRNAARSVTAMAAMLAHEVKNPLSGIRGAAQLLEQDADEAGPRADPADLRRDRPHRRPGRPHGGVLRPTADRARAGQHPRGAGAGAQLAQSGFARGMSASSRSTIPRCRRSTAIATC